jgi:hypothetical protein
MFRIVPGVMYWSTTIGWKPPTFTVTVNTCGESTAWGSETVTPAV